MQWMDLSQYLPMSLILIILIILGFDHFCFTSLISPTNFQQGITEISLFRSAINCTLIVIAPLILILPVTSPAELIILHYVLGYGCAALLAISLISPILHYNPSPSICYYIKLRFNQSFLSLITTRISFLSPYKICTMLGYTGIFAIAFGGQTTVSSNVFFASICLAMLAASYIIFDNLTNYIYNFVDIILSHDYLSFDSWTAFYLGILNGLHFLITSPLLYQQYFSLSSCRRLRESLAIHVLLFGLLTSIMLIPSNLFSNKINWFCQINSFAMFNVSHEDVSLEIDNGLFPSLINAVLSLVASFAIILTELTLINLIWEDLLRPLLIRRSLQQQIGSIQIGLLIIGSLIIALSNAWLYLDKPLKYGPISLLILGTLAAPMTALYTCSYLFPFLNGKGATTGLLTGIFGTLVLLYLYFRVTPLRFHHFPLQCFNETLITHSLIWPDCKFAYLELDFASTTLQAIANKAQKLLPILCEIPIAWYPLTTFIITALSMLFVSLCTCNSNTNEFDWKLIICIPYFGIFTRHTDNAISNDKHVAFVECESFRLV
uniref:Sodium:solute symporter family protein n=1 Tax=Wuchereria bancrofti TaxID=6293 RepID=A0A1I8EGM4_WUCBA